MNKVKKEPVSVKDKEKVDVILAADEKQKAWAEFGVAATAASDE